MMILKHDDNTCFNCGKACEELHPVPQFDYMGCDDCMEEALRVIAAEAAGTLSPAQRQQLAAARIGMKEVA